MHRGWIPTLLVIVTACNFSADPIAGDGPPPSTFRIAGMTSSVDVNGATPLANVTVEAYSDRAGFVASTRSADAGVFSLTLMQDTGMITHLHATHLDYIDTYLYPPKPVSSDFTVANAVLLTPQTFQLVGMFTNVTQLPGKGWIALAIVDNTMAPVADAVAVAAGGDILYNGANGLPTSGPGATGGDGIAYVFNAPIGSLEIGATKAGIPFSSHAIDVRPDLVTIAFVAP